MRNMKNPTGMNRNNSVRFEEPSEELTAETLGDLEKVVVNVPAPALRSVKRRGGGSTAKESSPKRGNSLLRLFGSSRRSKAAPRKNGLADQDELRLEEDPVMALFQSRSTQRVRFSLEVPETKSTADTSGETSSFNIKQFMKRTLFNNKSNSTKDIDSEDEEGDRRVVEEERERADSTMLWEGADTGDGAEIVQTRKGGASEDDWVGFVENRSTRAQVDKLLGKARRAQYLHGRYEYAVQQYVKAMDLLKAAQYPDNHPTFSRTMQNLNHAHHLLSSYKSSANIVKMGLKHEDSGELVRALKMYTIAYRIRRDNLSRNHPSLVVLLNMLGSVQVKRMELNDAMQIYELAMKDGPLVYAEPMEGDEDEYDRIVPQTSPAVGHMLLARSVTYREMGTIYEQWSEQEKALEMYQLSLDCASEFLSQQPTANANLETNGADGLDVDTSCNLERVHLSKSSHPKRRQDKNDLEEEKGEMEVFLCSSSSSSSSPKGVADIPTSSRFAFFRHTQSKPKRGDESTMSQDTYADIEVALTLHQMGQLHRRRGEYATALDAYNTSLRGMKYALGDHHPNVAAILGNIGNLQKEMGDMDDAYDTYQEVLGIESYRLGLSHPDVAISLHNIATIDAARGNLHHALTLYRKVLSLQKKLFGEDHESVSVTAACMGDVYERIGDLKNAAEYFEEALRIKTATSGRHALEVSRLLHKLGKISFLQDDYHVADSYISRAVLIYRLNKLPESHDWVLDAFRDAADIDAAIALGRGKTFEC